MKKPLVLHPFLLAIFFVLYPFAVNAGKISSRALILPLIIVLGASALVWSIVYLAIRSLRKSGLMVSLFFFLFFSYRHFFLFASQFGSGITVGVVEIDTGMLVLILSWGLLLVAAFYIDRTRRSLMGLTDVLNIMAGVLVLVSMVQVGLYAAQVGPGVKEAPRAIMEKGSVAAGHASLGCDEECPDIYYILVDGYASEDVLKDFYGHDNAAFCDFLRERGFYVADKARSNYCQTGLSLSSTLNMEYLDNTTHRLPVRSSDMTLVTEMAQKSAALRFLRERGYVLIAFSSGRPETEMPHADIYVTQFAWVPDEFQTLLLNSTPLPKILSLITEFDRADSHRDNMRYIFDTLAGLPITETGHVFVFAHIELPHPPFVFDREGEAIQVEEVFTEDDGNWLIRPGRLTADEYREQYIDQLVFLNSQLRKVVDGILARPGPKPVIIIQSDHGPRSMLVWEKPEETNTRECMSILYALYLPDYPNAPIDEVMTPVNTFRIIFNHYFGTDYERLPDKSFFSTAQRPYRFIDVTSDALPD